MELKEGWAARELEPGGEERAVGGDGAPRPRRLAGAGTARRRRDPARPSADSVQPGRAARAVIPPGLGLPGTSHGFVPFSDIVRGGGGSQT